MTTSDDFRTAVVDAVKQYGALFAEEIRGFIAHVDERGEGVTEEDIEKVRLYREEARRQGIDL